MVVTSRRRRPGRASKTPSGDAGLLGIVLLGVAIYYFFFREAEPELASTVQERIAALDRSAAELRGLSEFIADQKRMLEEHERVLQTLRAEEEELSPAIQANRQTVNAILAAEAKRQQDGVWWSRIEGFGMGVLSSMVASLLWRWLVPRSATADE
jgi:hypothetical protein